MCLSCTSNKCCLSATCAIRGLGARKRPCRPCACAPEARHAGPAPRRAKLGVCGIHGHATIGPAVEFEADLVLDGNVVTREHMVCEAHAAIAHMPSANPTLSTGTVCRLSATLALATPWGATFTLLACVPWHALTALLLPACLDCFPCLRIALSVRISGRGADSRARTT